MIYSDTLNTYSGDKVEHAIISPQIDSRRKPDITGGVTYINDFEKRCADCGVSSVKVREKILDSYNFDMKKHNEFLRNKGDTIDIDDTMPIETDYDDESDYFGNLVGEDEIDKDLSDIDLKNVYKVIEGSIGLFYRSNRDFKISSSNRIQNRLEDNSGDGDYVSELELEEVDDSVEVIDDYDVKVNDLKFALLYLNSFTEREAIEMTSWALTLYNLMKVQTGKYNDNSHYETIYFSTVGTTKRLPRSKSENSKRTETFIPMREEYWNHFTKRRTIKTISVDMYEPCSDYIFASKILYKLLDELDVIVDNDGIELASYDNIARINVDMNLLNNPKSLFYGLIDEVCKDILSSSESMFTNVQEIVLKNLKITTLAYDESKDNAESNYGLDSYHIAAIMKYLDAVDSDVNLYKYHNLDISEGEYRDLTDLDDLDNYDEDISEVKDEVRIAGKVAIAYVMGLNRIKRLQDKVDFYDEYVLIDGGKEGFGSGNYTTKYQIDSNGFVIGKGSTLFVMRYALGADSTLVLINSRGYAIRVRYNTPSWFAVSTIDNFIEALDRDAKGLGGVTNGATNYKCWRIPINV